MVARNSKPAASTASAKRNTVLAKRATAKETAVVPAKRGRKPAAVDDVEETEEPTPRQRRAAKEEPAPSPKRGRAAKEEPTPRQRRAAKEEPTPRQRRAAKEEPKPTSRAKNTAAAKKAAKEAEVDTNEVTKRTTLAKHPLLGTVIYQETKDGDYIERVVVGAERISTTETGTYVVLHAKKPGSRGRHADILEMDVSEVDLPINGPRKRKSRVMAITGNSW